MNHRWMAWLSALAGLPLALAQPADPGSATPAPQHRPVFKAPAATPEPQDWRDANQAVGQFPRGHADLLKWESQNLTPTAEPAPVVPNAAPLTLERALALAWARQLGLFTLPGVSPAERAAARLQAMATAHETRRAWLMAVAAESALVQHQATWEAADTGAELAQRMWRVGHWTAAQHARERQTRLEAGQALVMARQEAISRREQLNRTLGLWGEGLNYTLPAELPEPPATTLPADDLERLALQRHAELAVLSQDTERQVNGVGPNRLAAAQRALEGLAQETASRSLDMAKGPTDLRLDPRTLPGWSHALERALKAQADTDALATRIRSHVREAWHRYRAAHELHQLAHTEALALAELQQQDRQQRYNGMLASTWELLASTRAQAQTRREAIDARRDFWLAHNDLMAVLAGGDYTPADAPRGAGAKNNNPQGH